MTNDTARRHLWRVGDPTWYAALVSGGSAYGLARLAKTSAGIRFDVLDRTSGAWVPTPNGASYFTEIGGITDAVPIDVATAEDVRRDLMGARP